VNVFVLSTGRCGSFTFAKACSHMRNFTSGHESRTGLLGAARFEYAPNHIEVDNRLSWMLGRLDEAFGDSALYVHLTRDRESVARSYFARTIPESIAKAYQYSIMMSPGQRRLDFVLDMVDTVNSNIQTFLRDKSNWMPFRLETAPADFRTFWERVGAEGNLEAALGEWNHRHNRTLAPPSILARVRSRGRKALSALTAGPSLPRG
jgi:hypothetical protein